MAIKVSNKEVISNLADFSGNSATFTAKVTSESTSSGDDGATLTTKDYVDGIVGGGLTAGDGIDITDDSGKQKIAVDLVATAATVGLEISSEKLKTKIATSDEVGTVRVGSGLKIDPSTGVLSTAIADAVTQKGSVDLTAAKTIDDNTSDDGDAYISNTSGNMSDDWKTATGETATPTTVEVGDMVIKISTGWMFLKTGGVTPAPNLSIGTGRDSDTLPLEIVGGTGVNIPLADTTNAGVITATQFNKLGLVPNTYGTVTVKQNGSEINSFTLNDSTNTEIDVKDSTYDASTDGGLQLTVGSTGSADLFSIKLNATASGLAVGIDGLAANPDGSTIVISSDKLAVGTIDYSQVNNTPDPVSAGDGIDITAGVISNTGVHSVTASGTGISASTTNNAVSIVGNAIISVSASGSVTASTDADGNVSLVGTDENTEYDAGTDLSLSGTTFNVESHNGTGTTKDNLVANTKDKIVKADSGGKIYSAGIRIDLLQDLP